MPPDAAQSCGPGRPFADGGEPQWQDDNLKGRWGAELDDWRRMVAPGLARKMPAPRIRSAAGGSSARYFEGVAWMDVEDRNGTMVHELSHLLEADRETFERAVAFFSRRTAGDPISEVVRDTGILGRRDKFSDPKSDAYAGRIYAASTISDEMGYRRAKLAGAPGHPPAREQGDRGDVDVRATEILSVGMERLWRDPVGFAAADPEYFDFVWGAVVRGK